MGGGTREWVWNGSPLPPREFGGREPRKKIIHVFIMQNSAFWCILVSENGQLLTGADPEGTDRGRGLGVGGDDAEGIDVRGAQSAEQKTLKASRGGEWERGFRLSNRLLSLGKCRELWPKTDFSAFKVSQNASP